MNLQNMIETEVADLRTQAAALEAKAVALETKIASMPATILAVAEGEAQTIWNWIKTL